MMFIKERDVVKFKNESILEKIREDNPDFDSYKREVVDYKIENFEVYSSVLHLLGVRDVDILLSLSNQFEECYSKLSLSLNSEVVIFKKFVLLGIKYPFTE